MSSIPIARTKMLAPLRWCVYLLSAYPIINYLLHIHPLTPLGGIWDKAILLALAYYAYTTRQWKPLDATQKMIVFVLVLGLGLLMMNVGDLTVTFAGYRDDYTYMIFPILLPYVIEKEDMVPLIKWVVLIGFLVAMHGVYEYIVKIPDPASWADPLQHERTRIYSIFGSPNIMGSYMAFITPLAAGVTLYEKNRGQRIFYGVATAMALFALLFTFTRGAWVGFFVAAFVFTLLVDRRWTIGLLVASVIGVLFVHPIHARVFEILSPVYISKEVANGRIARWINAYDEMRTSPLFGVGMGYYGGAIASQYFGITYVDNYYAKTLAETGLVGLGSLLTLFAVYWRGVWRVWKEETDPQTRYLIAGVLSSLTALLVHNAMENVFEEAPMYVLFWLVGSVVLIYGRKEAEHA
ncbi:MAG: O-antigen ligase family protein [Firmicutes bacterium]|nr:O-antigen ligase family protein [Bacillota bacterium]